MKFSSSFLTVLTLLLALNTAAPQKSIAADWPNFRGPNHNGISTETLLADQLKPESVKPLWMKNIGLGCSSVAVTNGRLYTMSNTGKKNDPNTHNDVIYCLNADTGAEIWRHTYKCGFNFKSNTPAGPFATPTVNANMVYTFSRKGDVFCLDALTGKVRWYRDLKEELQLKPPFQGGFAGSPLVLANMVILNAGHAGTALDRYSGKVIWLSEKQDAAQATPVPFHLGSQHCIAIFSGFGLVTVNARTGKILHTFPWDTKYKTNVADPIIAGDKVFISSWYKMGCALLDISGPRPDVLWQNKDMQNHYSSCVLWKGYLYGFNPTRLRCMDFNTGQIKWTLKGGTGRGSLVLADGKLIVLTENGTILIGDASPHAFTPILKTKVIDGRCFTGPVFSAGKIYVRNLTGDLACVALTPPKIANRQSKNAN